MAADGTIFTIVAGAALSIPEGCRGNDACFHGLPDFSCALGEYIWRALDASRNRPPFIEDETKGFDK